MATAFDGAINIYVEPEDAEIYSAIKKAAVCLSEYAEVKDGIMQGKVADLLFVDEVIDNNSKPLLYGEDVTRFNFTWKDRYVNYNKEAMMEAEIERRGKGKRPALWMLSLIHI